MKRYRNKNENKFIKYIKLFYYNYSTNSKYGDGKW